MSPVGATRKKIPQIFIFAKIICFFKVKSGGERTLKEMAVLTRDKSILATNEAVEGKELNKK